MDGRSGLPLFAANNPGHLLRQTKLPGQDAKNDSKKVSWVRAAFQKTNAAAEKQDSWQSCIACSEARSTNNITRMKEHLLVCMPYLLSDRAAAVKDDLLQQRVARARAAPSGMGQSTLTSSKSSTKRKLMRAFCDELTQSDAKKLKVLFAEMVVATNMPHSWVEHAAVQKFFKALRPAFQMPSRHQLSTPLLLGIYATIAAKVNAELSKHKWLTITADGWSREQGSLHITNYHAAVPGASYFIDITTADIDQVTGESSGLAGRKLCLPWPVLKHSGACSAASPKPVCAPYTAFLTCLQHASWRTLFWRSSEGTNWRTKLQLL